MQHRTGLLLMTEVRQRVIDDLPDDLGDETRAAACKAVDDTLHSLMMLVEGVVGSPGDESGGIDFEVDLVGQLVDSETGQVLHTESLRDGDGACMGLAGWLEGDYGDLL
ncbi:hypothetical protein EII34_02495 [Arachnia propionica]|uniref:Uncharacterized protein n=1 Tax=Arachnia propionica TaxID=1750 RepID=A0A3P1TD40_9ACTN|nr:hypothetical protein [Arachnia propionica]MDO5084557.1 hypothetical protein [Arachnia propionica]RRD07371.1 hypothetical protein EII34_02495 [Arachnia propionica]